MKPPALAALLAIALVAEASASPAGLIPLDTKGPRPTAMLTIENGPAVPVIMDTGATITVLSTDLGAEHKLKSTGTVHVRSPGATRSMEAYRARLPHAQLGDVDITGADVVVGELGVSLPGIAGVMSANLFKGQFVVIELAQSRFRIVPRSSANTPQTRAWPYSGDHPLPSMPLEVAGVKLSVLLDTGSALGLALPVELASRLPLQAPPQPAAPAHMASGLRKAFTARIIGEVHIGPITLTDPEVTLVERLQGANIGYSILKNWTVVLDTEDQRSWVIQE